MSSAPHLPLDQAWGEAEPGLDGARTTLTATSPLPPAGRDPAGPSAPPPLGRRLGGRRRRARQPAPGPAKFAGRARGGAAGGAGAGPWWLCQGQEGGLGGPPHQSCPLVWGAVWVGILPESKRVPATCNAHGRCGWDGKEVAEGLLPGWDVCAPRRFEFCRFENFRTSELLNFLVCYTRSVL
jgi:hypothetical protein